MSNMVVRTNNLAINSHRNLGMTGTMQARASQRLSSGFRINSAADDAAGLAISEKMRGQIRGLDQASRNGQDGISLIQTAEGAMGVINDMVIRIRELVVQAANDTYAHDGGNIAQSDRIHIQREINHLMDEIDAITLRTEFNTRTLLDGSLAGSQQNLFADISDFAGLDPADLTAAGDAQRFVDFLMLIDQANNVFEGVTGVQNVFTTPTTAGDVTAIIDVLSALEEFSTDSTVANATTLDTALAAAHLTSSFSDFFGVTWDGTANPTTEAEAADLVEAARLAGVMMSRLGQATPAGDAGPIFATVGSIPGTVPLALADEVLEWLNGMSASAIAALPEDVAMAVWADRLNEAVTVPQADALNEWFDGNRDAIVAAMQTGPAAGGTGDGLWFHIGANVGQGIRLNIDNVNVRRLSEIGEGLRADLPPSSETLQNVADGFSFYNLRNSGMAHASGIMLETGYDINRFITSIDAALAHVASERANLGAIQNRLEFTIENLDVASENLSAANSRIRDADMAQEMMRFTQSNVLQQAAISMLAQANQAPQAILSLLR